MSFRLTDSRFKYDLLSKAFEEFQHSVPNSMLYMIETIGKNFLLTLTTQLSFLSFINTDFYQGMWITSIIPQLIPQLHTMNQLEQKICLQICKFKKSHYDFTQVRFRAKLVQHKILFELVLIDLSSALNFRNGYSIRRSQCLPKKFNHCYWSTC